MADAAAQPPLLLSKTLLQMIDRLTCGEEREVCEMSYIDAKQWKGRCVRQALWAVDMLMHMNIERTVWRMSERYEACIRAGIIE